MANIIVIYRQPPPQLLPFASLFFHLFLINARTRNRTAPCCLLPYDNEEWLIERENATGTATYFYSLWKLKFICLASNRKHRRIFRVFFTSHDRGMRNDEFGDAKGAHDAGFNELFCSPLVQPLNRRFNQCLSSRTTPFSLYPFSPINIRNRSRDNIYSIFCTIVYCIFLY